MKNNLRKAYKKANTIATYQIKYFSAVARNGFKPKVLSTYPDCPDPRTMLYKIAHVLGYRMVNQVDEQADIIIQWQYGTFKNLDAFEHVNSDRLIVNQYSQDISKEHVDRVHRDVFGYSTIIDPLIHRGRCVQKSNFNARHDGRILDCPIQGPLDPDSIYQILINNELGNGMIEDIRVPMIDLQTPFCYIKHRPIEHRFTVFNKEVAMAEPDRLFSAGEMDLLRSFARTIRLDYGELDVLRDRDTGHIYVIDVNNTPFGPPNHLPKQDGDRAVRLLAATFAKAFENRPRPDHSGGAIVESDNLHRIKAAEPRSGNRSADPRSRLPVYRNG